MEIRAFAKGLLAAEDLAGKLAPPPPDLSDRAPGPAFRADRPGRPPGLWIVPRQQPHVPPPEGMHDPAQRARILHALANHELQAVELFAWALLAFPGTPRAFRRGCVRVVADEQRHLRMYLERLEAHGMAFGDLPVSGHFWKTASKIETPLEFVCTMGLTFENANLDFCDEHVRAARAAGDDATARTLATVHADEIRHVRFAWTWLLRWKRADETPWNAYCRSVRPPHGPDRARGRTFDAAARRRAGLDDAFVGALERTSPTRPGGARR